jgi:hypothetical protein
MNKSAETGKKQNGFEKSVRWFQAANIGAIAVEAALAVAVPPVAPAMKALIGFNVLQLAGAEVALQAYKGHRRRKSTKTGASNARLGYAT